MLTNVFVLRFTDKPNEDDSPFICPLEHKDDDIDLTSSSKQRERTRDSPFSLPMTSTGTLTKDIKLSRLTVFPSSTTTEVTDDFYFDTGTLRADFSNTAILVTSSSGPTSSASPGPHLGRTTLSLSHSFRNGAKELTSAVQETHSFTQKIQPTKTSQQSFFSSNVIESEVTDKVYFTTVIFASHSRSMGSMASLTSVPALSTPIGLHFSTTTLSPSYSSGHMTKAQTSSTLTGIQGILSFTQNIQATKTLQQRLSSSNASDLEVSLVTRFASTVSLVGLSSPPALFTSGGLDLITTRFSQSYYFRPTANELTSATFTGSQGMLNFTQNIQATKASQQRILSSIEVSGDVYSNNIVLKSQFTSAHAVSMVILSSRHTLPASDGLFLRGNKSSFTKEVPGMHSIQLTKTSQQRMFSSDATGSKGN